MSERPPELPGVAEDSQSPESFEKLREELRNSIITNRMLIGAVLIALIAGVSQVPKLLRPRFPTPSMEERICNSLAEGEPLPDFVWWLSGVDNLEYAGNITTLQRRCYELTGGGVVLEDGETMGDNPEPVLPSASCIEQSLNATIAQGRHIDTSLHVQALRIREGECDGDK